MSEHISYNTSGTCSRKIEVEIENGIVTSVKFNGGCAGNTQGVAALCIGHTPEEIIEKLSGIKCGFKSTSCPDQLAKALKKYLENN